MVATFNGHSTKHHLQNWATWLAVWAISVLGGCWILPLVRIQPEGIHTFFSKLAAWQRGSFIFFLCVLLVFLAFKLFSPRTRHLKYVQTQPPIWLACLIAVLCVAGLDLTLGLSPGRYAASVWEWIAYAGGAVAVVVAYKYPWWLEINPPAPKTQIKQGSELTAWSDLESWLRSDGPAEHDFLNQHAVALRLKRQLCNGIRSVGVIGQFGAGKTTIVNWMIRLIEETDAKPLILISKHSCWGFDNSSSAIQNMLSSGLACVSKKVDTFHVSSLPESYRYTFSGGGHWVDNLTKLAIGQREPMDQFGQLSEILADMDARLVFIVEDLDRNDSRSFDLQDVLAFLQQMKEFDNLSFVLTGGIASRSRIDFSKLCDHIEYLPTITPQYSSALVAAVREHSLSQKDFPHEVLSQEDDNPWSFSRWLLLSDHDQVWPPEALSILLSTPRALRHVLARTEKVWASLAGEIDWDHLLAVNVLRYAAPEAFTFMLRNWSRIHDRPSDYTSQHGQLNQIRTTIRREWGQTTQGVEWEPRSARAIIDFILPPASTWFEDNTIEVGDRRRQGVQYERYWLRAVNETLGNDAVRDQAVARDLRQWCENPTEDAPLIQQLCRSLEYGCVWEDLASRYLQDDRPRILQLCTHVLNRIVRAEKHSASDDSIGFVSTWRYANRHVPASEETRQWLQEQIADVAHFSLQMVNSLWHYYGPGRYSIIRREDIQAVRSHVIETLRQRLTSGEALMQILDSGHPYGLYQLIFDPSDQNPTSATNITDWTWLAPILLDSLRADNAAAAVGLANMLVARTGGSRREPVSVDMNLLDEFFGFNTGEVIERLRQLADRVTDQEQRQIVSAIAESARTELESRTQHE